MTDRALRACVRRILCVIGLCGAVAAARAAAPDYEGIVSARLAQTPEGEVLRLGAGPQGFIGLFIAAAGTGPKRAVILLHGMGGHADWPEVVAPLRRGLPAQGWATLSIQLPVLAPGAPAAEYGATLRRVPARIDGAAACLAQRGYGRIALVGYGLGATAAAQYLAARGRGFSALIGISMDAPAYLDPPADLPDSLRRVPVPVLDLYGSADHADILAGADDRRIAGTQNRDRVYEQALIEGADHDYAGFESALVGRIVGWLDGVAAPSGAADPEPAARTGNRGEDACKTKAN